jgi:hypothetical protein
VALKYTDSPGEGSSNVHTARPDPQVFFARSNGIEVATATKLLSDVWEGRIDFGQSHRPNIRGAQSHPLLVGIKRVKL